MSLQGSMNENKNHYQLFHNRFKELCNNVLVLHKFDNKYGKSLIRKRPSNHNTKNKIDVLRVLLPYGVHALDLSTSLVIP